MSDNGTFDGRDDLADLLAADIPLDPDEAAGRTSELGTAPVPDDSGQPDPCPAETQGQGPDPARGGAPSTEAPGPVPGAAPDAMAPQTAPATPAAATAGTPSPLERYVGALREEVGAGRDGEEVYVDPGTLLALAQACLDEARAEREQRLAADEAVRRDVAAGLGAVSPVVTVNPTINISSVDAGDAVLHAESLTLPPAAAGALAGTHASPQGADSTLGPARGDEGPRAEGAAKQPARRRRGVPATAVGIAIGFAILTLLFFLVLQALPGVAVGAPAAL